MSTASSTPCSPRLRMKFGSMGEMPPSTMGISGFTLRMARDAAMTILEKMFQFGSRSRFQCDMLLGSFQSITASTIPRLLNSSVEFHVEDVLAIARSILGFANERFRIGRAHDVKAGTAQHSHSATAVGNKPIRVIA